MVTRIEARDLAHTYPDGTRALDGVRLALEGGELLAVIGPNGSGKSTLLRCLAGLLAPSSGDVLLDGANVRALTPRQRARSLAVVPQYLPALPELAALDFVLGGRYAHAPRFAGVRPADLQASRAALERADAADLAERSMGALSGGQRQRVLFARALAQEAGLVLLDEPTSFLDPRHQLAAFALIASACRGTRAALVVTHDLNLASQFATRLALLDRGRLVAQGAPEEILRPEVLEPVYGPCLYFGRMQGAGSGSVFVLPWAARSGGPQPGAAGPAARSPAEQA
jgi:iron complex transport system ATP-binding protein